jgi:putative serine protease PepD
VPESEHPHKPRRWLLGVVLGGAVAVAGCTSSASSSTTAAASSGSSAASVCAVTSVANQVIPSVVTIAVSGANASGTGSGEVIRSDGYILTNNHVIAAAASGGSVQVQFSDGQAEAATIVGRDPQTDVAVLKVASSPKLKVIALGSSASVQVGQPVVVIGAPLGLSGTVTSGIVSALNRTVQVPGENNSSALLVAAVQTDAAINPGNSGGAMVNCAGQLIGVPSAGATVPSTSGESSGGSIGLGFAIPVDLAKSISDEIIATGKVTHSYFGVGTVQIPPAAAAQAGVPEGLLIEQVAAGGPAASAGLQANDVITSIDGTPATSNIQLQEVTLTKKPGDTVSVGYSRNGQTATATVTLAAQP